MAELESPNITARVHAAILKLAKRLRPRPMPTNLLIGFLNYRYRQHVVLEKVLYRGNLYACAVFVNELFTGFQIPTFA